MKIKYHTWQGYLIQQIADNLFVVQTNGNTIHTETLDEAKILINQQKDLKGE